MKKRTEIVDRRDGCILELDGNLHPHVDNPYQAALLQGWVNALSWVLDTEPRDRTETIENQWEELQESHELEDLEVVLRGLDAKRCFECPGCNRVLPLDSTTECDRCGAHLDLYVDVTSPPIDTDTTES